MKNKIIIFIILFLSIISLLSSERLLNSVNIRRLINPYYMNCDKRRVYIIDHSIKRVLGYSIYTLKKNFEIRYKKGQGPGDFPWAPAILTNKKNIMLFTTVKIAYYNKQGQFLHEKRFHPRGILKPFGNNYIFFHYSFVKKAMFNVFELWNSNLKRIKTIIKRRNRGKRYIMYVGMKKKGTIPIFKERILWDTGDNQFIICDPADNYKIKIYDNRVKHINTLEIKYPNIKIMKKDKIKLVEKTRIKMGFNNRKWKELLKQNNIYCPEYFPPVQNIKVADGNLYIRTYKVLGNNRQYIIVNLKTGKSKKLLLPETDYWAVRDNIYLFLKYSENDDLWGLNSVKINLK